MEVRGLSGGLFLLMDFMIKPFFLHLDSFVVSLCSEEMR